MPATREARTLPALPASLEVLHTMLDEMWGVVEVLRGEPTPPHLRYGLATAVGEVAANVMRHAGVATFDFELAYYDEGRLEACFHDTGVVFHGPSRPGFDPDVLPEGGMGLVLARRGLHALGYQRLADGTNCWTLVQDLPVPG